MRNSVMLAAARRVGVVVLAAAVFAGFAVPANASAAPLDKPDVATAAPEVAASSRTGTATHRTAGLPGAIKINSDKTAKPQVCAEDPEHSVTCVEVKADGSLEDGLPREVIAPKKGEITTQWEVGIGWYVYLYLNDGDISWLVGLGYAGASAAVCAMLVATIAGAAVCGVAFYIVWEVLLKAHNRNWVGPGECLELKFRSGYEGSKVVRRNC